MGTTRAETVPADWKPAISNAKRLIRSGRFLDAVGVLEALGEVGLASRSISTLRTTAMVGFAKKLKADVLKEKKAWSPERRAREKWEANAIPHREQVAGNLRLNQALALAHTDVNEASSAAVRCFYEGGMRVEARENTCLCIIRRGRFVYRVFHTHPRSMGPGPYRHWKSVFYDKAEILKEKSLGDWGAPIRPSTLGGDPSTMAGGAVAVQDVIREIFSL